MLLSSAAHAVVKFCTPGRAGKRPVAQGQTARISEQIQRRGANCFKQGGSVGQGPANEKSADNSKLRHGDADHATTGIATVSQVFHPERDLAARFKNHIRHPGKVKRQAVQPIASGDAVMAETYTTGRCLVALPSVMSEFRN